MFRCAKSEALHPGSQALLPEFLTTSLSHICLSFFSTDYRALSFGINPRTKKVVCSWMKDLLDAKTSISSSLALFPASEAKSEASLTNSSLKIAQSSCTSPSSSICVGSSASRSLQRWARTMYTALLAFSVGRLRM